MQRAAEALVEAFGTVLYQGLRAAVYERLAGHPLSVADQGAPTLGRSWPSQAAGLGGAAQCPPAEASAACPTVCLGLAVDASGEVSPLLLATVFALLGVTACCSFFGGCYCACLIRARRALAAPLAEPARGPLRALAYGPGPQAAERGAALSARMPTGPDQG